MAIIDFRILSNLVREGFVFLEYSYKTVDQGTPYVHVENFA